MGMTNLNNIALKARSLRFDLGNIDDFPFMGDKDGHDKPLIYWP